MVFLIWEGRACGLAQVREVKAPYLTLEEAQAQAEHDLALGRTPLRIEDATTKQVLWKPAPKEETP